MAPRPYQDLQELRRNGIMKGRSPGKGQRGPPPFLHPHLRKEKQLESGSRGAKVRGWRQEEAIVLGNHLESHMTHMYRQVHLSMSHINSEMQTHNRQTLRYSDVHLPHEESHHIHMHSHVHPGYVHPLRDASLHPCTKAQS